MSSRAFSPSSSAVPVGSWRWAAAGFLFLSFVAAVLAVLSPQNAQWAGVALLVGIAVVGCVFLFAIWPSPRTLRTNTRRMAAAAQRANVAWAITSRDGAVIDCNDVYRQMAGNGSNGGPPPPELALAGDKSAATLYRLSRRAAAGTPCEESFAVAPGLEIHAAVRPMPAGQTCWWFTPYMAAQASGHHEPPSLAGDNTGEIFREAPIGMAILDSEGILVDANGAFRSFFGVTGALAGRQVVELMAEENRAAVLDLIRDASGNAASGMRVEVRPVDDDKQMADLFTGIDGGKHVILYLLDISEQKSLEGKFAQAQKMQAVGQLAGGVAHDFNNHLTVIIGNCEILLMRHQAGDPSFKEINEINQYALRAANLVRQLLAFSRKQTLQPKTLSLRTVVGELAIMLRRLLREGIDLKLEPESDVWPVHADEAQISNALINLVVNARDAMPKGGRITIRIKNETLSESVPLGPATIPPGDYVIIEVADTGTGISPENLDKIFDPFFTTKPVGQGTGLGLATVYGIVKQTGGFISVDSEVGRGTSFFIRLPRYVPEETAEDPSVAEAQPAPQDVTGQDTILLVEDEDAVRAFAGRALKMRGYNVLEAGGGEEALEIVRTTKEPIPLMISDVVMPNMDGPTLVREVKRIRPDIAVIFMSGYAEDAFQKNAEKAEDLHFLPKPFGLKQLAAKVKDVLSERARKVS